MADMNTKMVDVINAALEADGGNLYRKYLGEEMRKDSDAYKQEHGNVFRRHLGASLIGRECDRELWLHFRFCAQGGLHEGRLIRLFNRGHLEEARFIALLRQAGCQVWNTTPEGGQYRLSACGGHFGGSLDGVVVGVPEMPTVPMLLECKTHNDRSFLKLQNSGMQSAKPEHFIQMQIYMNSYSLTHGLYLAVNKNDDSLYAEIIACSPQLAAGYVQRAEKIIFAQEVPGRVAGATSSGWHTCKWCDFKKICWSRAKYTPHIKTCRTCRYVLPTERGWECRVDELKPRVLSMGAQIQACNNYGIPDSVRLLGV